MVPNQTFLIEVEEITLARHKISIFDVYTLNFSIFHKVWFCPNIIIHGLGVSIYTDPESHSWKQIFYHLVKSNQLKIEEIDPKRAFFKLTWIWRHNFAIAGHWPMAIGWGTLQSEANLGVANIRLITRFKKVQPLIFSCLIFAKM